MLIRHIANLHTGLPISAVLAAILLISGCSGGNSKSEQDSIDIMQDALVAVGDSILTQREVEMRIPPGLAREDSAALFNSIVEGWLEQMLLTDIALQNIDDPEEIDKMVEDYRKRLIITRYRQKLRESRKTGIAQKEIDRYYTENAEDMILDAPVVKGLYVKLPSDAQGLSDVRRWMLTATPDAIDNLEKYGLSDAIEYSFFEDKWTEFNTISRQIPYRFGNEDEFVARHKNFETSFRGFTYLLHISDYISSGEKMPREIADIHIREQLETMNDNDFDQKLISNIYQQAVKDGKLKYYRWKRM